MNLSNKKILIITGVFPPDIGGPASYAVTLGSYLSKDAKVTVLTYSSVLYSKDDKQLPFKVKRVWKKNFWILRHALYLLKALFSTTSHDVILSLSSVNGGIAAWMCSRIFKKKFYMKIVGDYAWQAAVEKSKTSLLIDDFQKSKKSGWLGFLWGLQGWLCRKSDGVIVPSEYLANMVNNWGVPQEKIHVIYNGTDIAPSDIAKEVARTNIGVHGNIILSVGRLVPWKGFKMLIKIMPQLLEINQFFRLVIVGDGPELKPLRAMVRNLGLERKVFIVGRKNKGELVVYMAAADMFVLNTGYEGFSHQILEAMACGVPVITTATGGNREIIEQGENGFMVKYNDEFNLIEAIKTLYQDPSIRDEFVSNARNSITKFSVDKMLQETTALLMG